MRHNASDDVNNNKINTCTCVYIKICNSSVDGLTQHASSVCCTIDRFLCFRYWCLSQIFDYYYYYDDICCMRISQLGHVWANEHCAILRKTREIDFHLTSLLVLSIVGQ